MILKRCTSCHEGQFEPLIWTSGAWTRADGVRVAYKHKLCLACVTAKVAPVHVLSELPTMTCPNCGIDTAEDVDPVYIWWHPKGIDALRTDAPFCGACAAVWRSWFIEGAEKQEDRDPSSRGTDGAPRYSAAQTLAALGIRVP